MEKHPHPFDEFLKETLKGHQLAPPEEAKKAFLKEAATIMPARNGWLKWYYIPILVVLISGIVAVLYFRNGNETAPAETSATKNNKSIQNQGSESNYNINNNSIAKSSSNSADLPMNYPSVKQAEVPVNVVAKNLIVLSEAATTVTSEPGVTLSAETTSSRLALDSLPNPVEQSIGAVTNDLVIKADTTFEIVPRDNSEPALPAKEKPENYFAAGAYYQPEWMFNTIEGGKFVNNYGFEGIFYRGPISIRTGAGISMSKGVTENAVTYNDYLGDYNKLDSVTFTFNESSHDFLPDFHMSQEKVWDSIPKLDSTNVIKRYTYLQIPLVLGFDFWQQGRFTIGVRVGTIMSVLLNSKQLSGAYDPGENLVVDIDRLSPDQVSINWQAIGGISASARLTKSIFFEIEPQAKYYYGSIYEKSGLTKKPWSVGLRTAIIYKFKVIR